MTPEKLIWEVRRAGGRIWLEGERIRCALPEDAAQLLDELRAYRIEIAVLLRLQTLRALCPVCGEPLVVVPHCELTDEHYGCAGCGRVYREHNGRLHQCNFAAPNDQADAQSATNGASR